MKLQKRFFLLLIAIFIGFMLIVLLLSMRLINGMNQQWGDKFTERQVLYDKYRTLLPLQREIALARQMAVEPAIINMARHEDDPAARRLGIAALEKYRFNFRDHSYFAAFAKSGNYYFNDAMNAYAGRQLRYRLSPSNDADKWFYATLSEGKEYQVNLDPDVHLNVTKAWINVLIKDGSETLGVIGTGLDLTEFLKETVSLNQQGVSNLFIDESMAIQLNSDPGLIDYMTLAKSEDQRRKVDVLLKNPRDVEHLRQVMHEVKSAPDTSASLWVEADGHRHLLGVAYLPEIGWYDLTLMDRQSLDLFGNFIIAPVLFGLLLLLALIAVAVALRQWVLSPIGALRAATEKIQQGDFEVSLLSDSGGEFAELSRSFERMAAHVRNSNRELEDKVFERTEELRRLTEVDSLTGLLNRRGMTVRFENEIARQAREGGELGLLLLDLDHFKCINDTYGHAAGDLALCETAKLLHDSKRGYDHAARWGGEEFLMLMPNCSKQDLLALAERIRARVSALRIQVGNMEVSFTVSIGAHHPNMPQTLDTMLLKVDAALYEAKDAGRNCVKMSQ